MFFQGGLLVQGGVAHVFIDRVYGHLSDVLRCLTEKKVIVNMTVNIVQLQCFRVFSACEITFDPTGNNSLHFTALHRPPEHFPIV